MADTTTLYPHSLASDGPAQCGSHYSPNPSLSSWDALLKRFQTPWTRHPRFYFDDGNVIFLVDITLFKLHRYFFRRDSTIFRSMFSLPPPTEEVEGESEDQPIKLTGVQAEDFATFLSILYPLDFYLSELTTTHDWLSVLKVATYWDFASIRMLAINKLVPLLSTAERIAVGKDYDVCDWLVPAYTELCMREQPLRLPEGEKLGMADVVEIYRIRSLIRYRAHLNRHGDTISSLVRSEFGLQ